MDAKRFPSQTTLPESYVIEPQWDRLTSPYAVRFPVGSSIRLAEIYSTSARAQHAGSLPFLIPCDCTPGPLFTCMCRRSTSEGFTPVVQSPTSASLARTLRSKDELSVESVRTLDVVPCSVSPSDVDYMWYTADQGLYIHSGIIQGGGFFHALGGYLVPPLIPPATGRITTCQVDASDGSPGHYMAGMVAGDLPGYPVMRSPLSSSIIGGEVRPSTGGSSLFNAVLRRSSRDHAPVLCIVGPATSQFSCIAKRISSLVATLIRQKTRCVRQIFMNSEQVGFEEPYGMRSTITGVWAFWSIVPKGVFHGILNMDPIRKSLETLCSIEGDTVALHAGLRIPCLTISAPWADTPSPLTSRVEFPDMVGYLIQRTGLLLSGPWKVDLECNSPVFKGSLFSRKVPGFYLMWRPEDSIRRPLSYALTLLYACIDTTGPLTRPRPSDAVNAEIGQAECIRHLATVQGMKNHPIYCCEDPYESMMRLGLTYATLGPHDLPGARADRMQELGGPFSVKGGSVFRVSGEGVKTWPDLIHLFRGTGDVASELPHAVGTSVSNLPSGQTEGILVASFPMTGPAALGVVPLPSFSQREGKIYYMSRQETGLTAAPQWAQLISVLASQSARTTPFAEYVLHKKRPRGAGLNLATDIRRITGGPMRPQLSDEEREEILTRLVYPGAAQDTTLRALLSRL